MIEVTEVNEITKAAMVTQRGSCYSRPVLLLATLNVKNELKSLRWNDVLNAFEYTFSVPRYILDMISSYQTYIWYITKARDQG